MAAGSTYTPIATTTISGSAQATITFSSIPSTYTDLVLVNNVKMDLAEVFNMRFNSDSATNYSSTFLNGSGSAAGSARGSNETIASFMWTGTGTNTDFFVNTLNIFNYANTTTFKTYLARTSVAGSQVTATVGLWRKTPEAISTITLSGNLTSKFAIGSTFTLYGIAAA